MHFPHTRMAFWLVSPVGSAGVVLACLILLAHPVELEVLYRPLAGGPATHPLTAVALLLLALPLAFWRPRLCDRLAPWFASAAIAVGVLRLVDLALGTSLLDVVTPFVDSLAAQEAAGKPVRIGLNTAVMTVLLGTSLLLRNRQKFLAGQVFAFLALGFPLVAATGYAYGLEKFHGQMALSTVALAILIGAGILATSAHRAVLRAVLSPWLGGRIARMQILLSYLVPLAIGYVLVAVIRASAIELFGLFVVILSGFIVLLVATSSVFQERVDHARRAAERRLAIAATLDPLTGTANRRLLMQTATREVERANRQKQPLSLLMVDIDHFKDLNDRYGHTAGDLVLVTIAGTMQDILRKQDLLARYGGEEFAILLPDTPLAGAWHLAEKIRRQIENLRFANDVGTVTVSIGCADNRGQPDFHQLIITTDRALYAAKALGRNRVEASADNDEVVAA
jgi:diguanylate cyclase (GGDEF)-like protein